MFPDSNRRQTSLEKLKPKRHSAKALRLLPSILRGNESIFHMTFSQPWSVLALLDNCCTLRSCTSDTHSLSTEMANGFLLGAGGWEGICGSLPPSLHHCSGCWGRLPSYWFEKQAGNVTCQACISHSTKRGNLLPRIHTRGAEMPSSDSRCRGTSCGEEITRTFKAQLPQ